MSDFEHGFETGDKVYPATSDRSYQGQVTYTNPSTVCVKWPGYNFDMTYQVNTYTELGSKYIDETKWIRHV